MRRVFFAKIWSLLFDMSRGFSLSCTSDDMTFTWPEKAFLDVKERYNKIQLHHLGYINLVNDGITWCRISYDFFPSDWSHVCVFF